MHEMLTILTDVRGVCLSVCLSHGLNRRRRVQCRPRAVCAGSFCAAFAKCFWLLVPVLNKVWFVICVKLVSLRSTRLGMKFVCCDDWWQDRGDSVLETILFVRRVTATSFRAYTVQAENQLGLTTHSARLIQSKLPQPYVFLFNGETVMIADWHREYFSDICKCCCGA